MFLFNKGFLNDQAPWLFVSLNFSNNYLKVLESLKTEGAWKDEDLKKLKTFKYFNLIDFNSLLKHKQYIWNINTNILHFL